MLEFQILTDNIVNRPHLLAEHGLSLWIKKDAMKILFDAGQTSIFLQNALYLGIPINTADAIVLSHGHYDHCAGVSSYPFSGGSTKIYVNPKAFEKKLSAKGDTVRDIGIPWSLEIRNSLKSHVVLTSEYEELTHGIAVLGGIAQNNNFESVSEHFFTEKDGLRSKDQMDDEQLLVIENENGLVVFSGCSHKGIVNCVEHVKAKFPGKKISTLVAGMHLQGVSKERLDATITYLINSDIENIIPLHCTGIVPICELKKALKDRCQIFATGDRVVIN
jgi:7,8-dihydropterin-6-yl-methyl-4-(beta-D-ribofuranosyl)aminobenzene 5'-phosphate synthase